MRAIASLCLLVFYVGASIYEFVDRAENSLCRVGLETVHLLHDNNLKGFQLFIVQRRRACFDAREDAWLRITSTGLPQTGEPSQTDGGTASSGRNVAGRPRKLAKAAEKIALPVASIQDSRPSPPFIDLTKNEVKALIGVVEKKTQLSAIELHAKDYKMSIPGDQARALLVLLRSAEGEL
jgi:hypothetical protein